ncbi:hypothetical protein RM780_06350 [Streptomyces sp. DSM 44917]|uniref:Phosphatidylethanolamine-binding protein n=1 Tax=Streptomyces boetiae TaxID=3075541 RepID=A0ABU2L582_9ACTN|nr:hypothetical protein [Streptomyces sp. DSM 44917]MDT0306581.1 hypothetical protein [Streptomyces sp. DSM 44917]
MPEPGSKSYDIHRARRRKNAENEGVSDQDANRAANEDLRSDPHFRRRGPRTERGRGPKAERPGSQD